MTQPAPDLYVPECPVMTEAEALDYICTLTDELRRIAEISGFSQTAGMLTSVRTVARAEHLTRETAF